MYHKQKMSGTPYKPHSNMICECFNCTLHNLIETPLKEHKVNWPVYLPSLVFAIISHPIPQHVTSPIN